MNYSVTHKPEMLLIGIECRISNAPDAAPKDIPQLWQKFYSQHILGSIPNRLSDEVVALYCDYEKDHLGAYTCVIGCKVSALEQIPDGMVGKTIPASDFAVYRTTGEFPQSVVATWNAIWGSSLKRTFTGDYELYGESFARAQEVEISVAIENEPARVR